MYINTKLHKNKDGQFTRLAVNGVSICSEQNMDKTLGRKGETFVSMQKKKKKKTKTGRNCQRGFNRKDAGSGSRCF